MAVDQETQQKLLQMSYLQSQGTSNPELAPGVIQPTLASAQGDHLPTAKHPAYRRGQ